MSEHAEEHPHPNYLATWGVLVVLLGVSLGAAGIGHKLLALTLIFGTALVKAVVVGANFMHLRFEPWLLVGAVLFGVACVGFLFFGVYPDIVPITLELAK